MSARRPTVGPAADPRMTPTTPVRPTPVATSSTPQRRRCAACHEGRRADLLESDLGMGVDVAADRSEFRVTIDDLGQQFHEVLRFDPET